LSAPARDHQQLLLLRSFAFWRTNTGFSLCGNLNYQSINVILYCFKKTFVKFSLIK
jgi:hypothetical protein